MIVFLFVKFDLLAPKNKFQERSILGYLLFKFHILRSVSNMSSLNYWSKPLECLIYSLWTFNFPALCQHLSNCKVFRKFWKFDVNLLLQKLIQFLQGSKPEYLPLDLQLLNLCQTLGFQERFKQPLVESTK